MCGQITYGNMTLGECQPLPQSDPLLRDGSETKVARSPGKARGRGKKCQETGSSTLGAGRHTADSASFIFGKPITLRRDRESWNPTVKRASMVLQLFMGRREKDCNKTDFSQAALRRPRVKFGKPLASPGIALGPRPPLLPGFSVPLSGRAPVARPSPGLTPRLSAQPVGHLGLKLLVGANSGAWPSPVALMGFHHPPAPLGWVPGRAQCCPGLSAATKERHPSLNRGGSGGEVWGPRVHRA